MNYKAFTLACVVGISSLVFTGCGRNYNPKNGVTTQSVKRSVALSNPHRTMQHNSLGYGRSSSLTYDMRGTAGYGAAGTMNGAATSGYGAAPYPVLPPKLNAPGVSGFGTTGIARVPDAKLKAKLHGHPANALLKHRKIVKNRLRAAAKIAKNVTRNGMPVPSATGK